MIASVIKIFQMIVKLCFKVGSLDSSPLFRVSNAPIQHTQPSLHIHTNTHAHTNKHRQSGK